MTHISFEVARDWLFAQETHSTCIIDQRESRHADGQRYGGCEMTILRDPTSKSISVYGCASWAEAKEKMEAKLNAAVDQSPQESVDNAA